MDGSTNNDASFWLTGWSGVFGNRQLDKEYITGFYLEIVLDSQSEIGTLLDGAIEFSNIGAFGISEDTVLFDFDDSQCTFEDGLFALSTSFERIEFLGKDCCQLCSEKSDCLYAISSGRDCFLAAELTSESVRVQYKRMCSLILFVFCAFFVLSLRLNFCSTDTKARGPSMYTRYTPWKRNVAISVLCAPVMLNNDSSTVPQKIWQSFRRPFHLQLHFNR